MTRQHLPDLARVKHSPLTARPSNLFEKQYLLRVDSISSYQTQVQIQVPPFSRSIYKNTWAKHLPSESCLFTNALT